MGALLRMREQDRYEDGLRRWCFGRGCIVPASSVSVQLFSDSTVLVMCSHSAWKIDSAPETEGAFYLERTLKL